MSRQRDMDVSTKQAQLSVAVVVPESRIEGCETEALLVQDLSRGKVGGGGGC